MRIVFTGGGSGGHFYPLIAVAEHIEDIVHEKRLISPELYYIGPPPFDESALLEHDIEYRASPAGKMRQYRSIMNILDMFKTGWGIVQSIFQLFSIYPDIIVSSGGYAAFPTLYAARILKIPVVAYDADAKPGRVSLWSAKFARWIALAHPDAAKKFSPKLQERTAIIGHPIRKEIEEPSAEGGHEFLKLDAGVPTLFFLGGSQGAQKINEVLLDSLKELVTRYNVVHQAGKANLQEVQGIAGVVLRDSPHKERYRAFALLNTLALRMTAGITSLCIARAGSGTIFELASWKLPCILVPLPIDVSHDQTENAFTFARAGAAVVIEQKNLSPHVLIAEIDRIMGDAALRGKLGEAASKFARRDAGRKLATIVLETALEHEPK
ncbi:UDP-N-acetylglucosamine--N-acetylmuramyl-(pentapeptide) pyrophosphoryl-undecaprenol N-acetylglucosamine transferase [Candidatus Kaiserbacteria bacterium]|nr:UDP-N-acetylglucosamine--N-acetylmuramyl-(pentapeptide) pyrophosphoryl-undecaprenol N-acetylglucosamine transferase [Candidatus Kaiserbacteria bacterium]